MREGLKFPSSYCSCTALFAHAGRSDTVVQQSFRFNKPACVYAEHCCSHRQLCVAEGDEMQLVLINILYCQALCDKEHTKNWLAEQIFNQLQAKIQLCSRDCTHRANSRGQSQLQECQYTPRKQSGPVSATRVLVLSLVFCSAHLHAAT